MTTRVRHSVFTGMALSVAAGVAAAETVTIGHFGNPTPMQVARADAAFADATGWDIEWREFDLATAVLPTPGST